MRTWLDGVIKRPVTVGMLTLAMVVFGWVSFSKLPIELLPDIAYPSLTIQTELIDAAPEEIEQLITDRIEPVVGVVGGLKRFHSISRAGSSEITLEFGWETDMAVAALDVREKLDLVDLPDEARAPIVYRFDPSLDPILRVALTTTANSRGSTMSLRDLRKLSETYVKRRLETLAGVAAAKVVGGAEEEVRVDLDEGRIAALGLTVAEVASRIEAENINRSGGELREAETAYLLRTVRQFQTLDEIGETIVRSDTNGVVRVRNIGDISIGFRDEEVRVRVDGAPAIELHIYKEGDANAVQVATLIHQQLAKLGRERRMSGVETRVLFDQARYIEESVANVQSTAMLGALLAAIVLFLFLRDLLSTVVIATSIPISVLVTFLCMRFADVSINVMSLGGLALGIGMLVDNSVVVLEAVRRRRENGDTTRSAVIDGTREVFGGVVASTLTTVSVFVPLIFVEGVAGQIFRDQALVVTFSLLASLLVSVTVIPCVLGSAMAEQGRFLSKLSALLEIPFRPFLWLFKQTVDKSTQAYGRSLNVTLSIPWLAPLVALALFVAIAPRMGDLGTELVPNLFQGEFYYEIELADGTPIETTDKKVRALEAAIKKTWEEHELPIKSFFVSVGGTPVLGEVRSGDQREHLARLNISLVDGTPREQELKTIEQLDRALATVPEVHPALGRPSLFTFRKPIEVEIYSDDLEQLQQGALAIAEQLQLKEGFHDVESGVRDRSPEVHVELNPIKLAAFNLSQDQVASTIAAKGLGVIASQYVPGERPIDIRVRVRGVRRGSQREIERLAVRVFEVSDTAVGDAAVAGASATDSKVAPIPLAALGKLVRGLGPVEVRHIDGERAAMVTARLQGRHLGEAAQEVNALLSQSNVLPAKVTAKLSGQHEEMRESLHSLLLALSLAVFLVYLVLASNFESLRLPFVVILTVPLGLIGAVIGLWITSSPVGILSMIGLIMLSGIVVNNGIIFIGRILQHTQKGLPSAEAARLAGMERLRPILITSTTTVLGLLPLAIGVGAGAELRQPLAITVIGGLVVATILTLFVIPGGYVWIGGRSGLPSDDGVTS